MTHFIAGAKGKLFEMGECANLVRNHWLLDGWEKDCHTRILQMQFPRNKKACSKIIVRSKSFQTIATLGKKKETKTCLKDNLPLYGLNVIKDGPTIGSAVKVSLSLLPWIKVVGLELYITFTFLCCKTPHRRAKEKKVNLQAIYHL